MPLRIGSDDGYIIGIVGGGSTDAGGFDTTCVSYNYNPQILGVGIHKQQQDDT